MASMEQLIADFTKQLKEAMDIGNAANLNPPTTEIRNVVATGLGGSGIGGNLVNEFVGNELDVPFVVNKNYFIPHFVDKHTLVLVNSYSGNTEETLSAFEQARKAGAILVCISSGGKVAELAKEYGFDHITVPGGNPPRSMLAYSVVQQLFVLKGYGLISNRFETQLEASIALLDAGEEDMRTQAKALAEKLANKVPVIYVDASMEAVGTRFRQQINENSKMLGWSSPVPEMNHNELVGWRNKIAPWAPVFLRNEEDFERNSTRMDINEEIVGEYSEEVLEIWSDGNSHMERSLYLIHLTDWATFYLAELNGVDVVEVDVIDYLKGSLAKA